MTDLAQRDASLAHHAAVPFGKYVLLERVAVGGMAEVWLGRAIEAGRVSRLIAVKRLLPSFSKDDEFVEMFIDEACIAGQLDHPGIVQIGELGRVGTSYYIAMEFVWGRDLLGIMQRLHSLRRSLEPTIAAYIAARMCESLHFAHTAKDDEGRSLDIVHRDVSPQNVIVSFDGEVKLIDFGIAKATSRSTQTQDGTRKGKIGYMSPEQARGVCVDHRSDQFAVGTVLYEMLTGRPLFPRSNDYTTMSLVREAELPPLREHAPECPPELAEVIMKLLAKRPEDRFPTAHDARVALDRVVASLDSGFERFALLSWMRALFAKEMRTEKARIEALEHLSTAPLDAGSEPAMAQVDLGSEEDEEADTRVFPQASNQARDLLDASGAYGLHAPSDAESREVFFRRELALGSDDSTRPFSSAFLSGRALTAQLEASLFREIGPYPSPRDIPAASTSLQPRSSSTPTPPGGEHSRPAPFVHTRMRTPSQRGSFTSKPLLIAAMIALPIVGLVLIGIALLTNH